jgi:cell wall-associated NlpC family hydrolase
MQKPISLLVLLVLMTISVSGLGKAPRKAVDNQLHQKVSVDREELISYARRFLGTPYHYASSSPKKGFDCSGFVNFVFRNFKIALPRSSKEFKSIGTDLKPEEFKVGDVVVFYGFKNKTRIGHVGIICEARGMQSKFIHASSGVVRGVIVSDLGSGMYTRRFFRCIDVIGRK